MRSNRSTVQAMDDAWTAVVAGAPPEATTMLTGVVPKTLERMQAALRKLERFAPETTPARMTWREAMHVAEQAKATAEAMTGIPGNALAQPRKMPSTDPVAVSSIAAALAMLDAALPSALMEYWAGYNSTRGVR